MSTDLRPTWVKNILVVGMARSGTTLVQRLLLEHPLIVGPRFELTDVFLSAGIDAFTQVQLDDATLAASQTRLFRAMAAASVGDDDILCLKYASNGGENLVRNSHRALDWIDDLKIIVIHREDAIAKFASFAVAVRNAQWHFDPAEKVPAEYYRPIRLSKVAFAAYYAEHLTVQDGFKEVAQRDNAYLLDFARLEGGDFDALLAELAEFLGLPPFGPVTIPFQKSAPPAQDFVSNHAAIEEIARTLAERKAQGVPTLSPAMAARWRLSQRVMSAKERFKRAFTPSRATP